MSERIHSSPMKGFAGQPDVIHSVPSNELPRRQYSPVLLEGHVERTKPHLVPPFEGGGSLEDRDRMILNSIANELNFGNPHNFSEVIESMYSMARNLGDNEIAGMSDAAFSLLDGARSLSAQHQFATTKYGVGRVVEIENDFGLTKTPHLLINRDVLAGDSLGTEIVVSNLDKLGVVLEPGHLALVQGMKIVAHEAGHMVQYGVGALAAPGNTEDAFNGYDIMSRITLQARPELMITPNLLTSSRIHNERFAEGYSNIVLKKVMQTLGYDDFATNGVIRAFGFERFEGVEVDYMQKVTKDTALSDLSDDRVGQLYDGQAGYSMPLSKQEVVNDLEELHRMLSQYDDDY